jgi:hypothetical protein
MKLVGPLVLPETLVAPARLPLKASKGGVLTEKIANSDLNSEAVFKEKRGLLDSMLELTITCTGIYTGLTIEPKIEN